MIELDNVGVRLGGHDVLRGVGTTFRRGELVAVLGPNGAGKTTLLRAIAGLVPATGSVRLDGREAVLLPAAERARAIAYLPQGHVAHWPIAARAVVEIGRMPHGGGPGRCRPADDAAVDRALVAADARALADRPITELSGGERARIMLARALAVEAPVLLADEPIAALDPEHQLTVMSLLAQTAALGACVLAALHDLTLAARFAGRVVMIERGLVVADGSPREVLKPELLAGVLGIRALHLEHEGMPVVVPWLPRADLRR